MNNLPTITKNLLIINVLMFFGTIVAERYGIDMTRFLGMHSVLSPDFNAAQFITYMFMHGGFSHLFFNMFALWMFGRVLEQVWGPRRFLSYYLICGIGAGLISMAVSLVRIGLVTSDLEALLPFRSDMDIINTMEDLRRCGADAMHRGMNFVDPLLASYNALVNGPTVGASGAVYAILLGFGVMFPNQPMFVFPLPFPVKTKYLIMFYVFIELFAGVADTPGDNVAHFAHLGGMLFGFILILYWRNKNKRNGYYPY